MFHFPASTPTQAMHSPAGHHTSLWPGFPIRTSSDQRFVGNSPRHNAASHVLHRLSMPRHPPYARNKTHGHTNNQGINTKTQKRKILASTIQFSHNTTPTHKQPQNADHPCDKGPTGTTMCCPRHPTVHQRNYNLLSRKTDASTNPQHHAAQPFLSQPHHHPDGATKDRQVCLHPAISTRGSRTLGDINHTNLAHNCRHTKTKTP